MQDGQESELKFFFGGPKDLSKIKALPLLRDVSWVFVMIDDRRTNARE